MTPKPRATLLALATLPMTACAETPLPVEHIRLPPCFEIAVFADDLPGARSLSVAGNRVYVGTRGEGRVYALEDTDGDGRAERRNVLARGLDSPNGVAARGDWLYVAEISRILRFPLDPADPLRAAGEPEVLRDDYPAEDHHGWKFIRFGPDGRLFVPIGAPCNVCDEPGHAVITSIAADGSDRRVEARGVRNTVGFDWHPETGVLWFTDNGRDWMGDDRPPDELNRAPGRDMHFGFPHCHGADLPDPEYGEPGVCERYVPPARELGPHVAALSMRFYTGTRFPERYHGRVFIAEHGSWNRSEKIGYRVSLVDVRDGEATDYTPFATGWLEGDHAWGRPVDVAVNDDGSLLVSDDKAGAVYRIRYAP